MVLSCPYPAVQTEGGWMGGTAAAGRYAAFGTP